MIETAEWKTYIHYIPVTENKTTFSFIYTEKPTDLSGQYQHAPDTTKPQLYTLSNLGMPEKLTKHQLCWAFCVRINTHQ